MLNQIFNKRIQLIPVSFHNQNILYGVQLVIRQETHLSDSATFSDRFSRSSIFCWPYWASNKYLAGPIGPTNDHLLLLAQKGQQVIISWPYWVSQIFIVGHNLLFEILHVNSTKIIFMVGMMLQEFTNKYICLHTLPNAEYWPQRQLQLPEYTNISVI